MTKWQKNLFLLFLCSWAWESRIEAAGINTNVALPVAKGHFIFRSQVRYTRATDDPSGAGRRLHLIEFPNVLVYGPAERMALFFVFPVLYRDLNGGSPRRTGGVGDLTFLYRYEIYKQDWILRTFRIALFGGLEVPSGDSPFSSGSIDVPLGVVATYQTARQEIDGDVSFKINTTGTGVDHGDEIFYNLAYQLRILPWRLPEEGVPHQLNAVLEFNGHFTQKDEGGGVSLPDTGGHILFLSPGLQYLMKRVILEASFQFPAVQDLNGSQLKTTWALNGGLRVQF